MGKICYFHLTLHESGPVSPALKGNNSYQNVQKHIILESSSKCANGLFIDYRNMYIIEG